MSKRDGRAESVHVRIQRESSSALVFVYGGSSRVVAALEYPGDMLGLVIELGLEVNSQVSLVEFQHLGKQVC